MHLLLALSPSSVFHFLSFVCKIFLMGFMRSILIYVAGSAFQKNQSSTPLYSISDPIFPYISSILVCLNYKKRGQATIYAQTSWDTFRDLAALSFWNPIANYDGWKEVIDIKAISSL